MAKDTAASNSNVPGIPERSEPMNNSRHSTHSPTDPEYNPLPDGIAARLGLLAPDLVQPKK